MIERLKTHIDYTENFFGNVLMEIIANNSSMYTHQEIRDKKIIWESLGEEVLFLAEEDLFEDD
jgi:hypothetical protein